MWDFINAAFCVVEHVYSRRKLAHEQETVHTDIKK